MEEFLRQLLVTSLLCSAAIVIVVAVSWIFKHCCKSRTFVWIGAAICVRSLFLLPLPALPGKGGRFVQSVVLVIQTRTQDIASTAERLIPASFPFTVTQIIFSAWVAGFLLFVMKRIVSAVKSSHEINHNRFMVYPVPICEALEQAKEDLGVRGSIALYGSITESTPFIMGLWCANCVTVYIPKFLYTRFKNGMTTAHEFYLLFRHELSHYIARDHLLGFLILLARAVHWFNPFFYFFAAWISRKIECTRDNMATKGLDDKDIAALCNLLDLIAEEVLRVEKLRTDKKKRSKVPINGHSFSMAADVAFRKENMYDNRPGYSRLRIFCIVSTVVVFTFIFNCSGFLDHTLNPASWNFPWKTAEASATVPGGEISFAYPIQNPTKILTSPAFGRDSDHPVNRLLFAADLGTSVYAPISGEIVNVDSVGKTPLGNCIEIENAQVTVTISHLTSNTLAIGDIIDQNQLIGTVDASGRSSIDGIEILVTDLQGNPVNIVSFLEGAGPIFI